MKNIQDIFDLISKLFADNSGADKELLSREYMLKQAFSLDDSQEGEIFIKAVNRLVGNKLVTYDFEYGYSLTEKGKHVLRESITFRLEKLEDDNSDCGDYLQRDEKTRRPNQIEDKHIICIIPSSKINVPELLSFLMDVFSLYNDLFKEDTPIVKSYDDQNVNIFGKFIGDNVRVAIMSKNIENTQWLSIAKNFNANVIICIADNKENNVKSILKREGLGDFNVTMFDDFNIDESCQSVNDLFLLIIGKLIKKVGELINCKEFKEFDIKKLIKTNN